MRLKRPVVSFDTPSMGKGMPVITVDHAKGGMMAAKALLESGCREVIQFTDYAEGNYPFLKRHEEFRRIMKENHVRCHEFKMQWNEFENTYFMDSVIKSYEKYPNVDGVFGTDSLVLYYMRYALEKGKQVPRDLKCVAYDGTFVLDMAYPQITAIVQPIKEIAHAGVKELIQIIDGKPSKEKFIQLDVQFRQGMTTIKNI